MLYYMMWSYSHLVKSCNAMMCYAEFCYVMCACSLHIDLWKPFVTARPLVITIQYWFQWSYPILSYPTLSYSTLHFVPCHKEYSLAFLTSFLLLSLINWHPDTIIIFSIHHDNTHLIFFLLKNNHAQRLIETSVCCISQYHLTDKALLREPGMNPYGKRLCIL